MSALDDDNRFDFNLTAAWLHDVKSAFVKRELAVGVRGRHRAHQGPQVRADARHPQPARRLRRPVGRRPAHRPAARPARRPHASTSTRAQGANCVYPGRRARTRARPASTSRTRPSCATASCRSTGRRQLGPRRAARPQYSRAARRAGAIDACSSGPTRKGFEYLGVGITWAAFNQTRDDTKPTWTLQLRRPAGRRSRTCASTRRTPAATPRSARATTSSSGRRSCRSASAASSPTSAPGTCCRCAPTAARSRSTGRRRRPASTRSSAAGVMIGVEQIAWENPRGDQRVTVEVRGARRGALLRAQPQRDLGAAVGPLGLHARTTRPPAVPGIDLDHRRRRRATDTPYPGVTEIEAYATFGGDVGLNVQVGRYIRFRGLFGLTADDAPLHHRRQRRRRHGTATAASTRPIRPRRTRPTARSSTSPGAASRSRARRSGRLFLEGSMMF